MDVMTNYAKVEEFKRMLMTKMRNMGLKDYLDVATEEDIVNLMKLTNTLLIFMQEKESDHERIELMFTYTIGLWARLLIEYGDDIDKL